MEKKIIPCFTTILFCFFQIELMGGTNSVTISLNKESWDGRHFVDKYEFREKDLIANTMCCKKEFGNLGLLALANDLYEFDGKTLTTNWLIEGERLPFIRNLVQQHNNKVTHPATGLLYPDRMNVYQLTLKTNASDSGRVFWQSYRTKSSKFSSLSEVRFCDVAMTNSMVYLLIKDRGWNYVKAIDITNVTNPISQPPEPIVEDLQSDGLDIYYEHGSFVAGHGKFPDVELKYRDANRIDKKAVWTRSDGKWVKISDL